MKHLSPKQFALLLAAIACFAVFFELGRMDIVGDNEGQRATPPAEMLRSGDYLIPTINGVDYLAKPPLLYWLIAGVYKATGTVSPLAARIPTAVTAVGLAMAAYLLFRREAGENLARWAALGLLISPYVLERARWAQIDVPLTFTTFLAIMTYRRALLSSATRDKILWIMASAITLTASLMLKGPVPLIFLWAAWAATRLTAGDTSPHLLHRGLILSIGALILEQLLKSGASLLPSASAVLSFPAALLAMLVFWTVLAWRSGPRTGLRGLGALLTVALTGAALAAPWAIAVLLRKGWPYINDLLAFQVVERIHTASRINSGTSFYYWIALPLLLAPWGLLLPLHFSRSWPWSARPTAYRFSLLTGGLSVLIFSFIAGKEYEYILPAFPFLILATTCYLPSLSEGHDLARWVAKWQRGWTALFVGLLPILTVGGVVYIILTQSLPRDLAYRLGGLGVICACLGCWAWKSRSHRPHAIVGLTLLAILIALAGRAPAMTRKHSSQEFARAVGQIVRQGNRVEASWARMPADFAFYMQAHVPAQLHQQRIKEGFEGPDPYFCMLRERDLEQLTAALDGQRPKTLLGPATRKRVILVGNRPLPPIVSPTESD